MIPHGRVHNTQPIRNQKLRQVQYVLDIRPTSQISRKDTVKLDPLAFPVGGNGRGILRQVPHIGGRKCRMGGEQGRREQAGLVAPGGEHRQGHRAGAVTQAAQVLDR